MADGRPLLALLGAQIRSQTAYRASFALDLVFSTAIAAVEIVAVLVMFSVNPSFGGFALADGVLIAGFASLAFTLAEVTVGNVDNLPHYIRTGLLDTVLLRPLGALRQLIVVDFALRRVGRVLYGLTVFGVGLAISDIDWTPAKVAFAVVAPVAGAATFGSIFVLGAVVTFWMIESGEVANSITYGGREFCQFPMTVFGGGVRLIFAYALGLASVAYLPALALLGRADPAGVPGWVHWCAPLAAVPWLLAARLGWSFGVRHYRSTGS